MPGVRFAISGWGGARVMLVARIVWNEAEFADGKRIAGYIIADLVSDELHTPIKAARI